MTDFGELEKACDAAVQKFNDLSDRMKAANARIKDISELQRHIGIYGKTREVYDTCALLIFSFWGLTLICRFAAATYSNVLVILFDFIFK